MSPLTHANFLSNSSGSVSDRIVATIRTVVPAIFGLILSKLIAAVPAVADVLVWIDTNVTLEVFGVSTAKLLELGATGAVIAGYYWLARVVGDRWPAVERLLLGSSKTPVYVIAEKEQEGEG